ncbi:hypothetical protein DUI87_04418 [Hirundo rustica rustica]|uniref:Endoplasmic reticulum junction formation protein lunapark n=1 Tax=Hirundo rustica rustica TaxID=333673 RepID=A0A3M0LHL3_HIRRU|nr:hypothetical protein DUI87_04418 [Hirundo rustica rustica]
MDSKADNDTSIFCISVHLEEVMEKETYKTAKLILERFDPESSAKETEQPSAGTSATPRPGQGLHPPGPPLARPVLPRERGVVDRVIEYLVGDGPQNRYALICQQCFSHNGMALKEEFEYIAFRCAYCYFLNPARKTRPQAPRLPDFSFEKQRSTELRPETEPLEPRVRKPQEIQETKDREVLKEGYSTLAESEDDVAQLVETNNTDDKAPSSEHLNDKLAEEVEKEEAENISATEEAISESTSAEQNEESLIKAE